LIHQTVGGTYKRNITAYTISYLRQQLGDSISLNDIWQTQNLSEELRKNIISVCVPLKNELISKAQDLNQNVTEWTKKTSCWEHFKKQSFPIASANPTPRPPKTREADSRPAIAMTNGVVEEIAGIKGLNECVKAELDLELPPPKWRWQKQSTWEYLGDSEVEIGNGETWHIFLGRRLIQGTGEGKTYHAAIDLDSVDAKAVDRLPPEHKTKIQQWLQAAEASNKEA